MSAAAVGNPKDVWWPGVIALFCGQASASWTPTPGPTLTARAPTAAPHPTPCSKANPQAFGNVLRRMLEAAGRGMWNADAATLEQLQRMYAELDDELEGIQR